MIYDRIMKQKQLTVNKIQIVVKVKNDCYPEYITVLVIHVCTVDIQTGKPILNNTIFWWPGMN